VSQRGFISIYGENKKSSNALEVQYFTGGDTGVNCVVARYPILNGLGPIGKEPLKHEKSLIT